MTAVRDVEVERQRIYTLGILAAHRVLLQLHGTTSDEGPVIYLQLAATERAMGEVVVQTVTDLLQQRRWSQTRYDVDHLLSDPGGNTLGVRGDEWFFARYEPWSGDDAEAVAREVGRRVSAVYYGLHVDYRSPFGSDD